MKLNPNDHYKELYVYMALEHGLIMKQNELENIVRICKDIIEKTDSKKLLEHKEIGLA